MPTEMTTQQHEMLDKALDRLLSLHRDGIASKNATIGALAQIVSAAALDDGEELMAWLRPEQIDRWVEGLT